MKQIKFQVRDNEGAITTPLDNLRDAVLEAARHDGYGAAFQRDEEGDMRLYSSKQHIGNNQYFPEPNDAFRTYSDLDDDDYAEAELAEKVYQSGVLHSKHEYVHILELEFNDGLLTHIDGKTIEDVLAEVYDGEDDVTVDTLRAVYK